MANCEHNVYESLHKRYLKETPDPQPSKLNMRRVKLIIQDLAQRIRKRVKEFDAGQFLRNKTGRLRRRYAAAYAQLCRDGVELNRISDISAFVKLERYFEEGKSPRMIMGRNPCFNILYAQVVEPIEKAFFELDQVANSCDYVSCGRKFTDLVGQWFMENDMSKFEGSQRLFVLRMEYMVYCLVFPHLVNLIDILFAYKIRKKGHTNTGVNFDFYECRGSGDMDTSLGNGILNYIATQYFLITNYCSDCSFEKCANPQCKTYKFVVKGDDSYASIPRTEAYVNTYEYFGFDAKINIRKHPEEVEFCSGHFLETRPGEYVYVQKLQKLIQSLTTCLNQDALRCGWVQQYYASLGKMYKVLYAGIPVYEDIADFLIRIGGKHGLKVDLVSSYNLTSAFRAKHSGLGGPIDRSLTYVSMAMINHMSIPELETIKQWFKVSSISFSSELSKRCNIKQRDEGEPPTIDFELLNAQVSASGMPDIIRDYYRKLRSFRSNW